MKRSPKTVPSMPREAPEPLPTEASWYDAFWREAERTADELPPWYQHLLPLVIGRLNPDSRVVELGCGHGHLLRYLARTGFVKPENLWGVDQSQSAVEFVRRALPTAKLTVQDLNRLDLPGSCFDFAVMLETIEHLSDPVPALKNVHRILKPGGSLFLSFPNYTHLPWLVVRILAEKLNRPNWIVLQPIDRIYFFPELVRCVSGAGFRYVRGAGSVYGPPVLYRWERPWMTRMCNRLRLHSLSFHPILEFQRV